MIYDAIIVGGGPTGLSAALILGRCRRRVLLLDSGQPRNAASKGISGFVSRDGVGPFEFRKIARDELQAYSCVDEIHGHAVDAALTDCVFHVTIEDGRVFRSRRLLLATGLVDELPPIEGLSEFWGKSVFVCPLCDGWEVQDRPMLAYGTGAAMPAFAMELLLWSRDLVVATPGECGFSSRDREYFHRHDIRLVESRILRLEGEHGKLRRVLFANGFTLARESLFLMTRQKQRSELPEKLGCHFTDEGAVEDKEMERTNIPGLYVAGNASKGLQLAIIAAAEGAKAAFSINESLQAEDTGFCIPEDLA
jgi:thioredoxin reductase